MLFDLLNDIFAVIEVVTVSNAGAIAGGIIGGVLIILSVGGIVIGWLYDRRKKQNAEKKRLDILSRYMWQSWVEIEHYSVA